MKNISLCLRVSVWRGKERWKGMFMGLLFDCEFPVKDGEDGDDEDEGADAAC